MKSCAVHSKKKAKAAFSILFKKDKTISGYRSVETFCLSGSIMSRKKLSTNTLPFPWPFRETPVVGFTPRCLTFGRIRSMFNVRLSVRRRRVIWTSLTGHCRSRKGSRLDVWVTVILCADYAKSQGRTGRHSDPKDGFHVGWRMTMPPFSSSPCGNV